MSGFSETVKAICHPRWFGWKPGAKVRDPCAGCPLYSACIKSVPCTHEAIASWQKGVNELAARLDMDSDPVLLKLRLANYDQDY